MTCQRCRKSRTISVYVYLSPNTFPLLLGSKQQVCELGAISMRTSHDSASDSVLLRVNS